VTPEEFIAKWRGNTRTERAAAQHHFLDLCDLLGVEKPGTRDYEFEKSTRKIGDTQGFADVWKDRCFIWEYKGDRKNLVQAYAQLKQYADAFEMASLFDTPEPDGGQHRLFAAPAANRGVGIHYTDEATIMKIIEPVVLAPLRREWEEIKEQIRALDARRERATAPAAKAKLIEEARTLYRGFRERLGQYRVLDPACGSGNFLALALRHLKDFDLAVLDESKALGLPPDDFRVGPEAVKGIEINGYAAELARLTVWITELQWQLSKGLGLTRRPILDKLDGIIRADALLTPSGRDVDWPEADVVVGNPPWVGNKLMRRKMGDTYVERLFSTFDGRVSGESDLVCYWFAKTWEGVREGRLKRAGLVATNSIRGGANRRVVDRIAQQGLIFSAWQDEPWVLDGVAARASLICFVSNDGENQCYLDGRLVTHINSDLSTAINLTPNKVLAENSAVAFSGISKKGKFELPGNAARKWLNLPINPNGRPNLDVLSPWWNGDDITGRPRDFWIVNFPERTVEDSALYAAPFEGVERVVRPVRSKSRSELERKNWWKLARRAPAMFAAVKSLRRFLVTPETAKYRNFVWCPRSVVPDKNLVVIARDDDAAFGVLQSRFHSAWALKLGTSLEDRPRYTSSTTFRTFPEGLTPNIPAADYENDPRAIAIAEAARQLDRLRNAWLNPPDLIRIEPEVVPGYPDRILPKDAAAEKILKIRTLTNLYNERPAWLANAHRDLDAAVAGAYGWPADISEEDALARLLALNLERAAAGR